MRLRLVAFRTFAFLAVLGVLAASLVVAFSPDDEEAASAGTPAVVEKQEVTVLPPAERVEYTPAEAAAVQVTDPVVPRIESGSVVAELAPHDLPAFELLGVTWSEGIQPGVSEVQVRWRQDGRWSDWTRLDIDTQEVEGGVPGTEPRWVGPSDAAQARVVTTGGAEPVGLKLVTVSPGETPTITPAATAQPGIIPRSAWGADNSGVCDSPRYGTMRGSVVHHTAGTNNYTAAQSAGIVKSTQAYHMNGQNWCDIGYNFLVDRYGQIFEGRAGGITAVPRGAHAGNYAVNLDTTGVSLMGNFQDVAPPQEMKDALVRLLAWKHTLHGVPVKGSYAIGGVTLQRIDGHRSVMATACPGQQVVNWMNAPGGLRDQVEQAAANGSASLLQVPGRPEVWLVAGGTKHHVQSYDDLLVLASRLGWVASGSASFIDSLGVGRPATRYVHDRRTGTLYLLQADGTKHRFPDVATIATFGYSFDSYVDLTSAQADAFVTGPEVGVFFRSESDTRVWMWSNGTKRYVTSPAALRIAAAGREQFAASMDRTRAAAIGEGPPVLVPHSLVMQPGGGKVYLTVGDSHVLHIPSFELAAEFGARELMTVDGAVLSRSPVVAGRLTPAVSCDGAVLVGAGGRGYPVAGLTAPWAPTPLPAGLCRSVPRAAEGLAAPVMIQVPGDPRVFLLENEALHHVRTYEALQTLLAGRPLRLLAWDARTQAAVGLGAPVLAAGSFVQFAGTGEVYAADARTVRHVTSYETLVRLGGGRVPPIEQRPITDKPFYLVGSPIS